MNGELVSGIADPAVLFFVVGLFVGVVRSNLEIPAPITKFLSLYLLMAIGFKGGQALAEVGLSGGALKVIGAAMALALVIPAGCFIFLRRRINAFDAAAIAATYGSVSAVTFVVASQYVADRGHEAGGYLAVALVVMESPAIVMAVLLATWARTRVRVEQQSAHDATAAGGRLAQIDLGVMVPEAAHQPGQRGPDEYRDTVTSQSDGALAQEPHGAPSTVRQVAREAFTDGAHLLLLGSMAVGAITGERGAQEMAPFIGDLFKGLLAFFLLEMGMLVARQLREVRDVGAFLVGFGLTIPFVNAALALGLGALLDLTTGDLAVLAALAASGSYIVVPAVIRYAIPEARPSRYFTLALGVTFPVNLLVGIPVFHWAAERVSG